MLKPAILVLRYPEIGPFLINRLTSLILGNLGILGICRKTQAVNQKQIGLFNLFGSGLSGLGNTS